MNPADPGSGRTISFLLARLAGLSLVTVLPLACWTGMQDCFPLPKLLALMLFGFLVVFLRPAVRTPGVFMWLIPLTSWIVAGVLARDGTRLAGWRAWPEAAILVVPAWAACAVPGSVRRTADFLLFAAVMVASYGLAQAIGWEPGKWISPFHKGVAATIGNPDLLGGFLVIPFALALARGIGSPGRGGIAGRRVSLAGVNGAKVADDFGDRQASLAAAPGQTLTLRRASLAVTFVLGAALIATEARAAWLAGAVASGILVFRGSMRTVVVTAAAAVWGLAFLLYLHPGALGNILSFSAFTERAWTWKIAGRALRSAPLAGHAAGSFRSVYMDYQARARYRGEEYFHYSEYAHNEPIHLAVETGVVGLGLAIWAVACLVAGWRLSPLKGTDPALWRGLGAGGAGFLANSMLSFPLHVPPTVVPLAVLLGLAVRTGGRTSSLPGVAGVAEGNAVRAALTPGLSATVAGCAVLAVMLACPFRLAFESAALYRGQAMVLAGMPAMGMVQYEGAMKLISGDVRLPWFAAAAAQQAGNSSAALKHSGDAVLMEPCLSDVWYTHGVILKAAGRDGEAEAAYRTALSINPGYAMAWNNLGNLLGARGRLREAEQAQRKALKLDPAFREARQNLALTLMMLQKAAEARRIMTGGEP